MIKEKFLNPETNNRYFEFLRLSKELGSELKKEKNNLGLFVFGSVASGKLTKDSDLDLCLIVKKSKWKKEPENVKNFIKNDLKVQLSKISLNDVEEDLKNFVDYRILQLRQPKVIFDKEKILENLIKKAKEIKPTKEVIKDWISNLKNDKKELEKIKDPNVFKLSANRNALWALRICLSFKGDFYEGGKTLEEQLERSPEISNLFIEASGVNNINLDQLTPLKNFLPQENNPWIKCAEDKLADCQELTENKKLIAAKMMMIDALVYLNLFLQNKNKYKDLNECLEKEKKFNDLISTIFRDYKKDLILKNYKNFNEYVTNFISR